MSAKRARRPLDLREMDSVLVDRFWQKVDIKGPDECWEWLAYREPGGYGKFRLRARVFVNASRVSLAMTRPLSVDEYACHRCDNPPCVNPAHLFAGTCRDNTVDSIEKGRANRSHGTAHRSARLTPDQVAWARRQDYSVVGARKRIAGELGIRVASLQKVVLGLTWKEVAEPAGSWPNLKGAPRVRN